jgi:hypothetical protein
MKTLVLSAWTENMRSVVEITAATKKEYSQRHGYEFLNILLEPTPNEYPAWAKVRLLLETLPTVDRLLWIDADSFVTNPEISLEKILYGPGFTASRDWGIDSKLSDFSTSGLILTPHALPMIEVALKKTHWANRPLWDQNALREAASHFRSIINVLPRRVLNAVPQELLPFAVEPWQEGDFLCHLTNTSNPLRRAFLDRHFEKQEISTNVIEDVGSKFQTIKT